MKIVFMGTPKFSVRILEALNEKYEVVLVVSQPDKEYNRKNQLIPTLVKQKANELNIEVFQPEKIKKDYQRILDVNADILVTAAYGQIIPNAVLDSFKKCINVHGSLLPKYRGGAPIQRSIINGDNETGITIMQMVQKMDAGCIYAQRKIDILLEDNNDTLFEKLSIIGKELLLDTIEDIYNDKLVGIPQEESKVTYAYNLKKEEEQIDFNKTSLEIFNLIRGLASNPGAYAVVNSNIIKVYETKILEDNSNNLPGTIISIKKKLIVKTLDGAIELVLIKPQGKQIMKASDFLNGQRIFNLLDIFSII